MYIYIFLGKIKENLHINHVHTYIGILLWNAAAVMVFWFDMMIYAGDSLCTTIIEILS